MVFPAMSSGLPLQCLSFSSNASPLHGLHICLSGQYYSMSAFQHACFAGLSGGAHCRTSPENGNPETLNHSGAATASAGSMFATRTSLRLRSNTQPPIGAAS